ncbi:Na(+)/H(+) antiporter subunit B [Streptomyces sp. NPDC001443]
MSAATAQEYLIAVALLLVAATATAAALARDPVRQALLLAVLGLCLTVLFTLLQAPDVALSQLAVGTAVTPLLILLTVRKVRRAAAAQDDRTDRGPEGTDEP